MDAQSRQNRAGQMFAAVTLAGASMPAAAPEALITVVRAFLTQQAATDAFASISTVPLMAVQMGRLIALPSCVHDLDAAAQVATIHAVLAAALLVGVRTDAALGMDRSIITAPSHPRRHQMRVERTEAWNAELAKEGVEGEEREARLQKMQAESELRRRKAETAAVARPAAGMEELIQHDFVLLGIIPDLRHQAAELPANDTIPVELWDAIHSHTDGTLHPLVAVLGLFTTKAEVEAHVAGMDAESATRNMRMFTLRTGRPYDAQAVAFSPPIQTVGSNTLTELVEATMTGAPPSQLAVPH